MPAAKLSIEDWKEVQRASEMGVDDKSLSQDYGVSEVAIRQRRFRERWLTQASIKAEAEAQKVKKRLLQGNGLTKSEKSGGVTVITKPAVETVAETITRLTDRNQLRAANAVDAAMRGMGALEIETVAELATGVKLLRLMDGRDKEGTSVAVQFGAFWQGPENGPEEKPVVVVRAGE